jgi:hypothetical protein
MVTTTTRRLLADLGLPDTRLVWVAAARQGIEAHRYVPGQPRTSCGRNQYYGTTACAVDAVEQWNAGACRRCWPATDAGEVQLATSCALVIAVTASILLVVLAILVYRSGLLS